jgi:hypothetical protein
LNEGKVVGSKPVIARRHLTTLFDPVKEPLEPVASAVEIGAEADRIAAVAFGGMLAHAPFSRGTDLAPPSLGDESSIFDDVESIRAASAAAKAK